MDLPEFSPIAKEHWVKRCGELSIAAEWSTVVRCNRRARRAIKARSPAYGRIVRDYPSFWYGISRRGVVFVVDQNQRVVTVFMLPAQSEAVSA